MSPLADFSLFPPALGLAHCCCANARSSDRAFSFAFGLNCFKKSLRASLLMYCQTMENARQILIYAWRHYYLREIAYALAATALVVAICAFVVGQGWWPEWLDGGDSHGLHAPIIGRY